MNKKNLPALLLIVFSVMLSSFMFYAWQIIYSPNILVEKPSQFIFIEKGSDFKSLRDGWHKTGVVNDLLSFSLVAKILDYPELIKPGAYHLESNMSNLEVVRKLRAGNQTPVNLTISSARLLNELPSKIEVYMAFDSAYFATVLHHDTTASFFGFTKENFIGMFIPNTYEVYWTESPALLLKRLHRSYLSFWNENRIEKANAIGLTPKEITVLASIVERETNKIEEADEIAGVYINRLKMGMKLQADPTLVFALGDYGIRRVLDIHKSIESPYNTYKNSGLPPGPIGIPSPAFVDAVLNYKQHPFLFFCANDDFSGSHVFAKTYTEHLKNARKFQNALDKQKIYR